LKILPAVPSSLEEWQGAGVPIMLVRALPVPLGKTQEAEIRDSYEKLGVDEFMNLYDTRRLRQRPESLKSDSVN
jgi:hypothetical protein